MASDDLVSFDIYSVFRYYNDIEILFYYICRLMQALKVKFLVTGF